MTREELVGELLWEGFPRREAEHEADLIMGQRDDDCLLPTNTKWELIVRLNPEYKES
jgi:hypothetical protein